MIQGYSVMNEIIQKEKRLAQKKAEQERKQSFLKNKGG